MGQGGNRDIDQLCGMIQIASSVPEVDADCGARWGGTYLDQVADLVDEPESPSSELASGRLSPADEKIVEVSSIAHFDDDCSVRLPEP
jgi:hypothetical protein